MVNNEHTHSTNTIFPTQSKPQSSGTTLRSVRQDKGASSRERRASVQPAPRKNVMRPHQMNSNHSRSQNRPTPKRKTIHLTLWVKPVVKAELQRIAEPEGVSISAAGGAFLEEALRQNLYTQHT